MRLLRPIESNFCQQPAYWENFLSDEDINYILSLPEWSEGSQAVVTGENKEFESLKIRNSKTSWMPLNEEHEQIWAKIEQAFSQINRTVFGFDITGFYEPAQLTSYSSKEKQFYGWHIDSGVNVSYTPRKLSMVLLLDDTKKFEGGKLQIKSFNDEPISVEQQKGRAWFFPSYMLHQVTPVTKGLRRSLVVWAGGPSFR